MRLKAISPLFYTIFPIKIKKFKCFDHFFVQNIQNLLFCDMGFFVFYFNITDVLYTVWGKKFAKTFSQKINELSLFFFFS